MKVFQYIYLNTKRNGKFSFKYVNLNYFWKKKKPRYFTALIFSWQKKWGNMYFRLFKQIHLNDVIWYSCNLLSFIGKSPTSVYFIEDTWYLGMNIVRTLYILNIMVISEVKGRTWWRHIRLTSILTFVKYFKSVLFWKPQNQFLLLLHILKTSSPQLSC